MRLGRNDRGSWRVLALSLLALGGCQSEEPPISRTVETERMPNQVILDFVLTETEGGRKLWTLHAERAKIFDSSNEINLDSLIVDFFDDDQAHTSTLTSHHGVINRTTHNMEAFGEVVIVTDAGLHLESDDVRWLNSRNEIVSDSPVRFTRGRNVLTGVGFVSDPSLENIEIRQEVRAEVRDPDDLEKEKHPEP
jgi:LPS export ABC transporter protein LptC